MRTITAVLIVIAAAVAIAITDFMGIKSMVVTTLTASPAKSQTGSEFPYVALNN